MESLAIGEWVLAVLKFILKKNEFTLEYLYFVRILGICKKNVSFLFDGRKMYILGLSTEKKLLLGKWVK
jgi:hypothetical protein